MNLPDAPIAHEGFFATHFFTVSDQDKSKDFYVRVLGGTVNSFLNLRVADIWACYRQCGDKGAFFLTEFGMTLWSTTKDETLFSREGVGQASRPVGAMI